MGRVAVGLVAFMFFLVALVAYLVVTDDCKQYAETGRQIPMTTLVGKVPVITYYNEVTCVER